MHYPFDLSGNFGILQGKLELKVAVLTCFENSISGIILAGGRSTRLNGVDKGGLSLGPWNPMERIYSIFSKIFDEIILVTNDPVRHLGWDLLIVTDLFDLRSSLTGLQAGLFSASSPYVFCVACDMPFINRRAVAEMASMAGLPWDVVIPETPAGLEPLFAVYSKRCLPAFERSLRRGRLKIQASFKRLKVKKVRPEVWQKWDPEFESFFNINTPEDLEAARRKAASLEPSGRHEDDRT